MVESDNVSVIRRMSFAWCITRGTDTHLECAIRIVFPRKGWFRVRVTVLRSYVRLLLVSGLAV